MIPGIHDQSGEGIDVEEEVVQEEIEDIESCISLNALCGSQGYRTMRVLGYYKNTPIHILIDSGSTQNFLDTDAAKRLGVELEYMPQQAITITDGNQLF